MKILVTGASGYVSSFLLPALRADGHTVTALVRNASQPGIQWSPAKGKIDTTAINALQPDVVIHLAGAGIADKRWSPARKKIIADSRLNGTRLLSETLASLDHKPSLFISASATGLFYPSTEPKSETDGATAPANWLSQLCAEWEAAADPARQAGIRVIHPRISVVLGPGGGAIKKMLPPFRFGLGGRLGPGTQYFSWISERDLVAAFRHFLNTPGLEGPFNLAAPNPCTNRELTKALGAAVKRPTLFPVPSFMVKLLFGEMGKTLLLGSVRARSTRLPESGFTFQDETIGPALATDFGKYTG